MSNFITDIKIKKVRHLENEIDRYEKEFLELDIKLDKIAPMLSDTIYLRFKESQDRIKENG